MPKDEDKGLTGLTIKEALLIFLRTWDNADCDEILQQEIDEDLDGEDE